MLLAGSLFRAVGFELNDLEAGNEHVRWTIDELADYLTGAIAQIASLKPTLFNSFVAFRLAPGYVQSVPAEYAKLIDVLYNLTSDGTPGEFITRGAFTAARALGRPSCSLTHDGVYVVRSYTAHPDSDLLFYVDPTVPNVPPYPAVELLVQLAPRVITSSTDEVPMANTVPELYQEALKDWMLYRAFAKDSESSDSFSRSQAHYKAFYQFIGSPPRDKDAVPVAATGRETVNGTATQ